MVVKKPVISGLWAMGMIMLFLVGGFVIPAAI